VSVEWAVTLLREGTALSGREYTRQAVLDVVAQTEGLHAYVDHTATGTPPGTVRTVRDLVGQYTGGYLYEDGGVAEARARLRIISHAQYVEDLARMAVNGSSARAPQEDGRATGTPTVGLSIDAVARLAPGGRRVLGIARLLACDIVTRPSAGGRFVAGHGSGPTPQRAMEAQPPASTGMGDGNPPEMPTWMREAAQQGLDWVAQGHGGDGLRPQTIAEAKRLAAGEMWLDKAVRMRAWLQRHAVDLDATGAMPGEDGFPSPGVVASALWGAGTKRRSAMAIAWLDRWIAATEEM
jgi:hypothetical protein